MASFTVHIPAEGQSLPARLEQARFIEDGFSWAAASYAPAWFVLRGAWLGLASWIAAASVVGVLMYLGIIQLLSGLLMLTLIEWLVGHEAQSFVRLGLRLKKWQMIDVIVASGRSEAEERFFADRAPILIQSSYKDDATPFDRGQTSGLSIAQPMIGIFPAGETRA